VRHVRGQASCRHPGGADSFRLNRAHPGKDTTYILDFVNDPAEVLASFKPYYQTAELAGVTDPNLVYDLRAKLDATGYYDDNEIERVVTVEMNPTASQAELSAALEPVADRLLRRYKAAFERLKAAQAIEDKVAEKKARTEVDALILFKRNLGSFQRVYSFLSQIFDYGNTAIEKRAIFYRRLLPLLDFGSEREGVDLSKVILTHHKLKDEGKRDLPLGAGAKLKPLTDTGSGEVREKDKVWLAEIIAKVNEIFGSDTTDGDKLAWLNTKKEKLLEKDVLVQQALSNTEEQFAGSPDLQKFFMDALIESYSAQNALDRAALNSTSIQADVLRLLLGPAQLWESLRTRGGMPIRDN
jgi:type I restriction enzyme R subunit